MGAARFLSANLITAASMLTPSSERPGTVGLAVKVGTGSATLAASGQYTGAAAGQYIVEIDSTTPGSGIGQATYRWKPSDADAWSASGVTTSTSPTLLESGVYVAWTSGGGADVVLGDYWTITCDKPFGRAKLLDLDRDTEWRSAGVAGTITIDVDLGSAALGDVIALLDHNLTAAATVTIKGGSSAPPTTLSETITWQAGNVLRYLTTSPRTYRYWRLSITDTGNPDGYLRIGSLFLGSYVQLVSNYVTGWRRAKTAATYGPSGALRAPRGVWAAAEVIELEYRMEAEADRAAVAALFDAIYDPAVGVVRPILFNLDSAVPADVSLYEFDTPELPIGSPFLNLFEWPLRLRQRPRIARSGS